jgi:hypothetical protein
MLYKKHVERGNYRSSEKHAGAAKNLLTKKLQAKEVCKIGVCPLLYY